MKLLGHVSKQYRTPDLNRPACTSASEIMRAGTAPLLVRLLQ
jgi:hypothetical protein